MSFKKVKVVMLSTNEKAKKGDLMLQGNTLIKASYDSDWANVEHLYFLSNEEIKESDWMFHTLDKKPIQWNGEETESNPSVYGYKKIIATTDKSLVEKVLVKRDEIGDLYRSFYLPEPSQSFIEKYVEEYNKRNVITEVLVEYEKKIEVFGGLFATGKERVELKINPKDNTITIKKVKDSWNRDEVIELLKSRESHIDCHTYSKQFIDKQDYRELDKWIEENL